MKRILLFVLLLVIGITLTACTGGESVVTPPTFLEVRVENTSPSQDGNLIPFYKAKSELVLIEVRLSNPSQLAIKSIIINGYTHNSTFFLETSTEESIQFYMNVGSDLEGTTYSVDKINYIDGETSQSINVIANNEFLVYVFKSPPTVTRENYEVQQDTISVDFRASDNDDVIVDGTLIAYLYEGDNLVTQQPLQDGLATILFEDLTTDFLYDLKVYANYDLDDGSGVQEDILLYSGSYTTLAKQTPSATITITEVTSSSVRFDVTVTDNDGVIVTNGLSVGLFSNDVLVQSIPITGNVNNQAFTNLLSDNQYEVRVVADYNLLDGSGLRDGVTLVMNTIQTDSSGIPMVAITSLDVQENSIEFDVYIDDEEGIIDAETLYAKLFFGDVEQTVLITNYSVDFQVNNLFANDDFTIEIYGDYDLNDGAGIQEEQLLFERTFKTLTNATPTINISSLSVLQGYINLQLLVNDPNSTLMGDIEAILFEEGVAVDSITFDATTTLLEYPYPTISGLSYYIEFYADYNLRDGNGAETNQLLRRVVAFTAEAKAPIAEIDDVTETTNEVEFDVTIIDADNTIDTNETTAELYLNGIRVDFETIGVGDNSVSFDGLFSDTTYTIVIVSSFNLDDGSGILQNQVLSETEFTTGTNEVAGAVIENVIVTNSSVTFDVDIVDPDGTVLPGTAQVLLYLDGQLVDQESLIVGENFGLQFTGLFSYRFYKLVVVLDYDLNNNQPPVIDFEVTETTVQTVEKEAPTAQIVSAGADQTSIVLDILVTDDNNVISGDIKAILLYDGIPNGMEQPLSVGLNSNVTFTAVLSNTRYTVQIVADYDLNTGNQTFDDEPIGTPISLSTLSQEPMVGSLLDSVSSSSSITIGVLILDPDGTLDDNLEAILYADDIPTGDVLPLVVGNNQNITFNGLDANKEYTIVVEADYSLNDIDGLKQDIVLLITSVTTQPKSPPSASIDSIVSEKDSITVDVTLTDLDGTISGPFNAVLYQDGSAVLGQTFPINIGLNTDIEFTGLLSGNTYEVRVIGSYDLDDIAGEYENVVMQSATISTIQAILPSVNITNSNITKTSISFNANLLDTDGTFIEGSLYVALYVDGQPINTQELSANAQFDISGMLAGYAFEIRFFGDYNLGDGNPTQEDQLLSSYEFTTLENAVPNAVISNVVINQNDLQLDLSVVDLDDVIAGNITAILYDDQDNALVTLNNLIVGDQSIIFPYDLGYDAFYRVVIYADYNVLDGTGLQSGKVIGGPRIINSFSERTPQVSIHNVVVTQDQVTFDVDIFDNDNVIVDAATEARLYLNGTLVATITNLVVGENNGLVFGGAPNELLSDNTFELRIVTDYLKDDNNGIYEDQIIGATDVTTNPKVAPVGEIFVDTVSATELIFDVVVTDVDLTGTTLVANLYDESGAIVGTETLTNGNNFNLSFDTLTGATTYILKLEFSYNLDNGAGIEQLIAAELAQLTMQSLPPVGTIHATTATLSTIEVEYSYSDVDTVATEQYLRIYDGTTMVAELSITEGENQTHTFNALTPNKDYTIVIESTYDLNDRNGLREDVVLASVDITTDSFIEIVGSNLEEISQNVLDIYVDDYEDLLTSTQINVTLYEGTTEISTYILNDGSINSITLYNLLSLFEYTLEFEATYDLGAGPVTEVIYTYVFELEALTLPEIEIEQFEFWTFTPSIEFDLTIGEDTMNVVVNNSYQAQLMVNGVVVETIDIDATYGNPENTDTTITFTTNLTGSDIYTVTILALVDLNEVPNEGAVVTAIGSMSGINAGN